MPRGEMTEWLKAHAWKACLGETLTWVRIPLSPPHSLSCRETWRYCSENRGKSPQFCKFCSQAGPEKVSSCTPYPRFRAFFSKGQTRSPVPTIHWANAMRSQIDDAAKAT